MTRPAMLEALRESPVRLAPMASFTNGPFRAIAVRCGSGFTTNEEIDAEAFLAGNARAEALMCGGDDSGLVAMQLLGSSAATLVPAALRLVEAGASIIDINMGCPVPKIVRAGKGAALMRDVPAAARVLAALRRALEDVPLTIKIRGGWDESQPNAIEVARMAEEVGVDAITVHPRTRAQRFGGRAPWEVIADVVAAVDIPVTGNGDVVSIAQAQSMMATTGCLSVMIGRAALGRPWIFDETYEHLDEDGRAAYEARTIAAHLERIGERYPPREALLQTKKHLARYASGGRDAAALRVELFAQSSVEAARAVFDRAAQSRREAIRR
ncbi:MAG: tRNA-dihydrouridine synthase [Chloroflexi bacterium]|nr:tRNA-dihydrouridine synthase [Chloroflexota bacterium]